MSEETLDRPPGAGRRSSTHIGRRLSDHGISILQSDASKAVALGELLVQT
jgi:hypothetical protein